MCLSRYDPCFSFVISYYIPSFFPMSLVRCLASIRNNIVGSPYISWLGEGLVDAERLQCPKPSITTGEDA